MSSPYDSDEPCDESGNLEQTSTSGDVLSFREFEEDIYYCNNKVLAGSNVEIKVDMKDGSQTERTITLKTKSGTANYCMFACGADAVCDGKQPGENECNPDCTPKECTISDWDSFFRFSAFPPLCDQNIVCGTGKTVTMTDPGRGMGKCAWACEAPEYCSGESSMSPICNQACALRCGQTSSDGKHQKFCSSINYWVVVVHKGSESGCVGYSILQSDVKVPRIIFTKQDVYYIWLNGGWEYNPPADCTFTFNYAINNNADSHEKRDNFIS